MAATNSATQNFPQVSRGPPTGRLMLCGWSGSQLTRLNMRAHFTICSKLPVGPDDVDRRGALEG
jgi:hypothetical protein